MNKKIPGAILIAAAAVLLVIPPASRAQQQPAAPPPSTAPMTHGGMQGDMTHNRMEVLSKALTLTDDQKSQLKPMLDEESTKISAVRADTSLTMPQKRQQVMAIHKDTHSKIAAMLTRAQKDKWEKMNAEAMEHHGGTMNGSQPPAGSAPPSQP